MLRWLFLILLLCNFALFAWGYRQTMPTQTLLPALPTGVSSILLVGEKPEERPKLVSVQAGDGLGGPSETVQREADDEPEQPIDPAPLDLVVNTEGIESALTCVRLGPLEQEDMAFEVINHLSASNHQADLKVVNDKEQSGYWVLISPGTEDPEFVIVNLELAGIGDVWRFTKGDLAGLVSLGLYSSRTEAEGRLQELSVIEFDAEIRPRHIDKYSYWIHTRYDPQSELATAALDQAFNQHPWLEFSPGPCPDIATSGENP